MDAVAVSSEQFGKNWTVPIERSVNPGVSDVPVRESVCVRAWFQLGPYFEIVNYSTNPSVGSPKSQQSLQFSEQSMGIAGHNPGCSPGTGGNGFWSRLLLYSRNCLSVDEVDWVMHETTEPRLGRTFCWCAGSS